MKKLQNILKQTKGASLILVLALMLLFTSIGVSIISASSTAVSTVNAQIESENMRRYAGELVAAFSKDVADTDMMSKDGTSKFKSDPWYSLARMIYEENYWSQSPLTAEITELNVDTGANNIWVSEDSAENNTKINITVLQQTVKTLMEYIPEQRVKRLNTKGEPMLDVNDNEIFDIVSDEILEQKLVRAKVKVEFKITHNKKEYILDAFYNFDGKVVRCLGIPDEDHYICSSTEKAVCTAEVANGEFEYGNWTLEGYKQN